MMDEKSQKIKTVGVAEPRADERDVMPPAETEADAAFLEMQKTIKKDTARIRQLKQEICSRQEENNRIINENLKQNEELCRLNQSLDQRVRERTRELQESKEKLEIQNTELEELTESKEAMMHMIVHDMKNPLTSIMGVLALSQCPDYEITPELKELLFDANKQSARLHAMIDDILIISKMRSKEFQVKTTPTNLVSLVEQCVAMMRTTLKKGRAHLKYEAEFSELVVLIDFPMIERVVNNIINNAIKYAPPGSEILVEILRESEYAKVNIRNQGEAIPMEYHQKIFELFGRARTKSNGIEGTGLGLAFGKLAIEAHGCCIGVESPISPRGRGVCFYFTLPLEKGTA